MTDRLGLTAAELAFMMTAQDAAHASPSWAALGLTESERQPGVLAAGLSSLLVRGLAVAGADQFVLAPPVAAVAEGLTAPSLWAEIGLVAPGAADGTYLFETATSRFLLAPRAHRCFEVTGLNRTIDLRDPLTAIVDGFLGQDRPGVVSLIVGTQARAATTGSTAHVIARDDAGSWSFGTGPDPEQINTGLSKVDALSRLRHEIAALVVPAP